MFGVLDSIVLEAVRASARDFFVRTGVWRHDMDTESVIEGSELYDLEPPAGTEVERVVSVKHGNNGVLLPKGVDWLNANYPSWRTATGWPLKYFTQDAKNQIRVVPIPSSTSFNDLYIRLTLVPLRTATSLDETQYDDWYEVILHGARFRLFRMPKKPWTDKRTAEDYEKLYEIEVLAAQVAANKDFTNETLRATPVPFI
jgi:hypothetical protein